MIIPIYQAKAKLSELIQAALAGKEVIIAKGKEPVIRLQVLEGYKTKRRLGGAKGALLYMSDDFDDPIDDFQEYI